MQTICHIHQLLNSAVGSFEKNPLPIHCLQIILTVLFSISGKFWGVYINHLKEDDFPPHPKSLVIFTAGLSSLGVPGVPWHPHILADQLTLSQSRGADYSHQIILAPPDFQTFLRPCYENSFSRFTIVARISVWSQINILVGNLVHLL